MPRARSTASSTQALADCDERGITGKDITPYLLGRIVELSDGRSLETNLALVRHNARVGTAIAVAFAALSDLEAATELQTTGGRHPGRRVGRGDAGRRGLGSDPNPSPSPNSTRSPAWPASKP